MKKQGKVELAGANKNEGKRWPVNHNLCKQTEEILSHISY